MLVALLNVRLELPTKLPVSLKTSCVSVAEIETPTYDIQLKLPEPSVLNTVLGTPPVILTTELDPNETFVALEKLTIPLLVKPVSVPKLVILG